MVKLSRLIMIFDMRRRGLSISAIACKTGLCRKTIHQHLKRGLENPASASAASGPVRRVSARSGRIVSGVVGEAVVSRD